MDSWQAVWRRLTPARDPVFALAMTVINVQASTAAHVAAGRPDAATDALLTIKAASKEASKEGLRELRAVLDVLRRADEAGPTRPVPGASQFGTLTASQTPPNQTPQSRRSRSRVARDLREVPVAGGGDGRHGAVR